MSREALERFEAVLRADRVRSMHAGTSMTGGLPTALVFDQFRAEGAEADELVPVLSGHFARFGEWNEIRSAWEGNFLERVDRDAFDETFAEHGPDGTGWIRAIFDHGHDPYVGMKPIGTPSVLEARDAGPYYEVPLFRSVPPLIVDGLRSEAYGASYRFNVAAGDEVVDLEPEPSESNPRGIPEVTIMRATVKEFGPTAFGADPHATAGVRSDTSRYQEQSSPARSSAEPGDDAQRATQDAAARAAFLRTITIEGMNR